MLRFFKLAGRSCQKSTTIEDTDCFPMLVLVHVRLIKIFISGISGIITMNISSILKIVFKDVW